jgi:hypothetical protein
MAKLRTLGLAAATLGLVALAVPAGAADLKTRVIPKGYCILAADSSLQYMENQSQLREEVTSRYDHAVEVATTWSWIYNARPVFTWATETELACGKAIGYLKGGTVDAENVGKCDCFHQRMLSYMYR